MFDSYFEYYSKTTKSDYRELGWNSIKNKKYDLIILGSSKAYCAYNPITIDSVLSLSSYNMSSGLQHVYESYFVLREILNYQKPKIIVLDIAALSYSNKPNWKYFQRNVNYFSLDNKIKVYKKFPNDVIKKTLFPLSFRKDEITNLDYWKKRISFKKEDVDINVQSFKMGWKFVDTTQTLSNSEVIQLGFYDFTSKQFLSNLSVLKKIKQICEENNIKLICIRTPYPKSRLALSGKDREGEFWLKKSNEIEIEFYDLNYLTTQNFINSDFEDNTHMNFIGSEKVTNELIKLLKFDKRN